MTDKSSTLQELVWYIYLYIKHCGLFNANVNIVEEK